MTVMKEPPSKRLCLEAPKESENMNNAIRGDKGDKFSFELESDCHSKEKLKKVKT